MSYQHGELIGALVGDWREAFYEARRNSDPDVTQDSLKKAFQRAQESLADKSAIDEQGHARFLTAANHQQDISTLIFANNLTSGHGT